MYKFRNQISAVPVILTLVLNIVGVGRLAWAAAPPEAEVQGLYEGAPADGATTVKLEARVVAQGNGNYNVFLRELRSASDTAQAELHAKTEGDRVTLAGRSGNVEWKGVLSDGTIEGQREPGGKFQVRRVEKKSPALGKKPPRGAVVLLDGKDFSELVLPGGARWDVDKLNVGKDGSIQVPKGGMNSKRSFDGSLDLHVEFQIPLMPAAHSQGRGNSGVFLPNSDEVQVLDSFGETTYLGGGCGGIYAYKDPDTMDLIESLKGKPECRFNLSSLPPLAWQTYDIEYRVEKGGKPRATVWHNGAKIHDRVELRSPNVGESPKGKLHFQDHGNPVRYRNIWVLPVP
jgi:hypothetical protein